MQDIARPTPRLVSRKTRAPVEPGGRLGGRRFAQQALRHKSAKASFRTTCWATVMMHCATVFGFW
jgi:hypothetical protein